MHVLDIVIRSLQISGDGKTALGRVAFTFADGEWGTRQITFECCTATSPRIRPDALVIGDAIRQLRRLPALQEGGERISFAKGLNPLEGRKAA